MSPLGSGKLSGIAKLKSSEILVCLAGLSALYTCYTANNYWHHLLSNPPEISLFAPTIRRVLIYLSFYVCMFSSVLMILFDEWKVLRFFAFASSFSLAAILTENYGYQDWFLHPVVMFNLLLFDVTDNDQRKSFSRFFLSVTTTVALVTATLLLLQFFNGVPTAEALSYKQKWLQLFELNPGVGFLLISWMPFALHWVSFIIFGLLLGLPLFLKFKNGLWILFIGAVSFWLLQKRIVQNNLLAWLLFMFPIILLQICEPIAKSKREQF